MHYGRPIATYWFLYFAGLGIFFPYYALYLRENAGLSGTAVGVVLASIRSIALFAQPLWGNLADRTGARRAVLALLTLATAVGLLALYAADGFVQLLVCTAAGALFMTAVLPISFSVAFAMFGRTDPHAFGLARVWGTVGFLVGVAAFPYLLDLYQARFAPVAAAAVSEPGLELMFLAAAALTVLAAVSCRKLPRSEAMQARAERGEWRELLRERAVRRLLVVSFLAYLFLQGPIEMFPLFVTARGGDLETVGHMWILMLLLEIPLVALSGAGVQRLGARALLTVGIAAGGLRWVISVLTASEPVLYAVQLLHGVVVTGLLLGGPLYLEKVVPQRLRSTAQSGLAMFGVGAGGLLSSILTGWLIDLSGVDLPCLLGGIGAVALGLSLRWVLPRV
jgi:MFS transporter, PPP family, 3-phenylpropionic acid transporter